MSVMVITRDEYHAERRYEYAGPASDLNPGTVAEWSRMCPEWNRWHWQMGFVPGLGTCLAPVNVVTG